MHEPVQLATVPMHNPGYRIDFWFFDALGYAGNLPDG